MNLFDVLAFDLIKRALSIIHACYLTGIFGNVNKNWHKHRRPCKGLQSSPYNRDTLKTRHKVMFLEYDAERRYSRCLDKQCYSEKLLIMIMKI